MLSTQPDAFPPPCYSLYIYIPLYLFTQGGGGGRSTSEKVRGALVHKRVENTDKTDYLQSINSVKHQ